MESCQCFSFIWSICGGWFLSSHTKKEEGIMLHTRENENEELLCVRMPYNGVANLDGFRAFLEPFKVVPWPFDFWDSKLKTKIPPELERVITLEFLDHEVNVIRSHHEQLSTGGQESILTATEPITTGVLPLVSSLPMGPVAYAPSSSSHSEQHLQEETKSDNISQDLQEETSCSLPQPKYKIFLSHSGAEKSFVEQLCKDLEAQNHFSFFDKRSRCLPKGEKFAKLILDAAKKCQVAVVVLSREYLSSKWPMVELVEFVRARRENKSLINLFPLFYKASVDDLSDESILNQWRPKWVKLGGSDSRVNLDDWAAAVRELRGVNGLRFEMFGNSEVSYREAIVKEVCKLTPADLLYDTSKTFGCDRICQILAFKFLLDTRTSAQLLGLYGVGGLGKTTIAKSLCNHFNNEFLSRVCYIEINEETKALERQLMVMRKLLRLDELLLQRLSDVSEGWKILQTRMKETTYPVFLVIDNVDQKSIEEAREYLDVEYSPGSKIMVISRSADLVEALVGDPCSCCEIPRLTMDEAAWVFLQQAVRAPRMDVSSLTQNERRVVEICLQEACFSDPDRESSKASYDENSELASGHYHPLALEALGVYFRNRSKLTSDVLSWTTYLHEYGKLKGTGDAYRHIFMILGLQFNTLDRMTQLMFLDISLFASKALEKPMLSKSPLEDLVEWLANVHEEKTAVVRSKISEFNRLAMININRVETRDNSSALRVTIHDLYRDYAVWFLRQINCKEQGLLGVWCVDEQFGSRSLPLELNRTPPGNCWQDLQRIRLQNIRCGDFPVGKVHEWCNVVVLQIVGCKDLTAINLQGLGCLCHLELRNLENLQTLTFTGDGSSSSTSSITQLSYTQPRLPRLQFVTIDGLSSVECLPSFSPFTSLRFLMVRNSGGLTQPPIVQHCSGLERMWLSWYPNQKTLPSLDGLTSLRGLTIVCWESIRTSALTLEGLSSLISLGALELYNIPVGDLSGLENITCLECIYLTDLDYRTCFPPLFNLARSSLHVLEVRGCNLSKQVEGQLAEMKEVIKFKLEGLAARGEIVPHTPSKVERRLTSFILP